LRWILVTGTGPASMTAPTNPREPEPAFVGTAFVGAAIAAPTKTVFFGAAATGVASCATSASSVVSRVCAISGSKETGTRRRPFLERVHRLLRDSQPLGQLDLGDVAGLALGGDALAQGDEEGAFVVGDGHAVRGGNEGGAHTVGPAFGVIT